MIAMNLGRAACWPNLLRGECGGVGGVGRAGAGAGRAQQAARPAEPPADNGGEKAIIVTGSRLRDRRA